MLPLRVSHNSLVFELGRVTEPGSAGGLAYQLLGLSCVVIFFPLKPQKGYGGKLVDARVQRAWSNGGRQESCALTAWGFGCALGPAACDKQATTKLDRFLRSVCFMPVWMDRSCQAPHDNVIRIMFVFLC